MSHQVGDISTSLEFDNMADTQFFRQCFNNDANKQNKLDSELNMSKGICSK